MSLNDDAVTGRILTRREVLALFGIAGLSLAAGNPLFAEAAGEASLPACVARPEQTEGPYFVDEALDRSDIRSNAGEKSVKEGVALDLEMRVRRVGPGGKCIPASAVQVDIWHCDAMGAYSNVRDSAFDTRGQNFLRGYQISDQNGVVQFRTIYPGAYPGRSVHIHFKIRGRREAASGFEFTSQLYFPESVTDRVLEKTPYSANAPRTTRNQDDVIYEAGGDRLLLSPQPAGGGYRAVFDIGLELEGL